LKKKNAFVLDASVTLSWVFEDESTPYTDRVLEALSNKVAVVPLIWPLEVGNGLLVAERRRRLTHAESVQFLNLLSQLSIRVEYFTLESMLGKILELARKARLSSYDASYLELSMQLGLPLATKDKVLLEAAKRCGVKIFAHAFLQK